VRTYISEKKQNGRRHWEGKADQRRATYANRRRVQGEYGKGLLRKRGELIERSFAHCYETGVSARTREHSQAAADPRRRIPSGSAAALAGRSRDAEGAQESAFFAAFSARFAFPPLPGARRARRGFDFAIQASPHAEPPLSSLPAALLKSTRFCHGLLGSQCN